MARRSAAIKVTLLAFRKKVHREFQPLLLNLPLVLFVFLSRNKLCSSTATIRHNIMSFFARPLSTSKDDRCHRRRSIKNVSTYFRTMYSSTRYRFDYFNGITFVTSLFRSGYISGKFLQNIFLDIFSRKCGLSNYK